MAREVASVGIRNRATIVGNICSAVPCLDSAPVLMLYDAVIHTASARAKRDIAVDKWFKAPRHTAIKTNELVSGITLNLPKKHGACFLKLKRYRGEDLAQASVAVMVLPENHYRIAFGAVAATPLRASKIERFMDGKELSDDLIVDAMMLVDEEISPITDIRSTKEYRLHMSKIMFKRAIKIAAARLEGDGPAYGSVSL